MIRSSLLVYRCLVMIILLIGAVSVWGRSYGSNFPDSSVLPEFSVLEGHPLQAESDTLDKWLSTKVKATDPGLAVGVVRKGQIVFEGYAGMANLDHQVPVGPETRFNIASVSKQFTALCVLDLIKKGRLSLDSDFRKYLPEFYPHISDPILISQLLNHSSGIRDLYELLSLEGRAWWARVGYDMKDAMAFLVRQQTLNNNPGEVYRYSNSGYLLLTEIVEKTSGISFLEYAQERFESYGLEDMGFSSDYMAVIPHKALPYSNWGGENWKQYPMVVDLYGDGFLFTTLGDQLKWETLIQKAESDKDDLLISSQRPISGPYGQVYGYGLEFNRYKGREIIEHAGATGSYGAHIIRFPEEELSIVVMTNNGSLWAGGLAREMADILLEPTEGKALASTWASKVLEDPIDIKALEGLYFLDNSGTYIRIVAGEEGLSREIAGRDPVKLLPKASNVFAYETFPDLKAVFIKDAEGRQTFELHQPGLPPRQALRLLPLNPKNPALAVLPGRYLNEAIGLQMEVVQTAEGDYAVSWEDELYPVSLPANDRIVFEGYTLRFQLDTSGSISGLLLDYGRIRNLELVKQPQK